MTRRNRWWQTGIGLVLTGLMLFPVYWMLNVSLTREQDMRKSPPDWFPAGGTLDGYRGVWCGPGWWVGHDRASMVRAGEVGGAIGHGHASAPCRRWTRM